MECTDPAGDGRITVVVLTHERRDALRHCLARLSALPERPAIVVVDNGSRDGTAELVRDAFPAVTLVALADNLGAAGRNLGVAQVRTPCVAFCDDDSWWAPGALGRAADLLQAHPSVGALAARVLVGTDNHPEPACESMATSPLPRRDLPGPAVIGFMAGAVVMRTAAFRQAGGYEARFFLGGEEALLALDLVSAGWRIAYVRELVLHHHPLPCRDARMRRRVLARNRLWLAWLRLAPRLAWHETRRLLRDARAEGIAARTLADALRGLAWVATQRREAPTAVQAQFAQVHGAPPPHAPVRLSARAESAR